MACVRFTADFDYKPLPCITIAYKAGMVVTVKRDCANQAIAAGRAVEAPPMPRKRSDGTNEIGR